MRNDSVLRALARGCAACAVLGLAGAAQAQLNEDWSSGTENGWTVSNEAGTANNWTFDAGLGQWFGDDVIGVESQYLTSPTFTRGADPGLRVEHWFDMEDDFDGGVLEISVNGGAWTYVPDTSIFLGQRYDDAPISTNFGSHIGGLQAFTIVSNAGVGNFVVTLFDLSAFATATDMVQIRFRLATDSSVAADGWYITSVATAPLVDPAGACCAADGTCSDTTLTGCEASGGVFTEGAVCSAGFCPDLTAQCCFTDGTCAELTEGDCAAQGGVFGGLGTDCSVACPDLTPTNDLCSAPMVIPSLPFSHAVDTTTALTDGPRGTCNSSSADPMDNSVWYSYTPAGEELVTVNVDGTYDRIIGVFSDCAGTIEYACGDETVLTGTETTQFVANAGVTYLIGVGDWGTGDGGGLTTVNITSEPLVPGACCFPNGSCMDSNSFDCGNLGGTYEGPGTTCGTFSCPVLIPNDECDTSTILTVGVASPGSTVGATGADVASCGADERDVWYALLPTPNTTYHAFTTGATANMSLAVFQQECPPAGFELACGDPATTDGAVDFTADALGSAIFIRAATDQSAETTFDITVIEVAGACSGTDGLCRQLTPTDCAAAGGTFNGGDCATGACCTGGTCTTGTAGACADAGGSYQGDGTNCGGYATDDTIAVNFEDISGTGTSFTLTDDAVTSATPIGFDFNYFGTLYTDVYIASNGFLTFEPNTDAGCCTGEQLGVPSAGNPDGTVAFIWEDRDPGNGVTTMYYQTLGTAPNRRMIIQFNNLESYPNGNGSTLQVKLFEGTNVIEFHYQSLLGDTGNHSIGLESPDASRFVQYYFGPGTGMPAAPLALSFTPDEPCDAPTCVCETDGDANQVNVFDLLSYLDLWFPSAPAADIDGTSGVNVFDLLFYLDCWFPASAGNPC